MGTWQDFALWQGSETFLPSLPLGPGCGMPGLSSLLGDFHANTFLSIPHPVLTPSALS